MKKDYRKYPVGSAEYVLVHATYRRSRGKKNPTVSFRSIRNPRSALRAATAAVEAGNNPELPASVVYYNKWTAFENRELANLFVPLSFDQLILLEKGATLWMDTEQPQGKVYGFNRSKVVSVEKRDDVVRIAYKGKFISGITTVEKKSCGWKFYHCLDSLRLLNLANGNPLVSETGTALTASEVSRRFLENEGFVLGLNTG